MFALGSLLDSIVKCDSSLSLGTGKNNEQRLDSIVKCDSSLSQRVKARVNIELDSIVKCDSSLSHVFIRNPSSSLIVL